MANWFCSKPGWDALTAWAASTAYSVGDIRRQLAAPTGTNHRVFRCTTAGTSGGAEPSWTLTKGSTTTDNTVTWTEITGNSTYNTTSFAAPHRWIRTAIDWATTAGDTIYIDDDHTETSSTQLGWYGAGTDNAPCRMLVITSTFSNPPVAADLTTMVDATGIENTSGSNVDIRSAFYAYGITLTITSTGQINLGGLTTANCRQIFDNCKLRLTNAGAAQRLEMSYESVPPSEGSRRIEMHNCTLTMKNTGSYIMHKYTDFLARNLNFTDGVTSLFANATYWSGHCKVVYENCDFTVQGASKYLVNLDGINGPMEVTFRNCKVGALAGVTTGTLGRVGQGPVNLIVSDDGTETYRQEHYQYPGSLTYETTVVRTGGASDGAQSKAWKVVTNANAAFHLFAFQCPPIYQWVDSTGTKTATVYIANTTADVTDTEVWMEVDYMGDASSPKCTTISTRAANILSTGATVTDDTLSTWGSSPTYMQKMVTGNFTINQKGFIVVRIYVAKASATIYVDPLVTVA